MSLHGVLSGNGAGFSPKPQLCSASAIPPMHHTH